ncbi:MAG TPA: HAMP domain-containing protein, partial [Nitrospirae bacterium]|nr:HAMP domain-containing protein [Nitrospirota bacterium]
AIMLIFIFAGAAIGSLIISKQRNILREEMNNNQILMLRNIARESIDALIFMDPLRLDELIKTINNIQGCVFAIITDNNMRIVGHTNKKNLGKNLREVTSNLPENIILINQYVEQIDKNNEIREIIVPIMSGYETIGLVIAGFSKDSIDNAVEHNLRDLRNYIFIVIGGAMLVSIWGAFGMAKLITTPIKKLKDSMELVQEGNLSFEIVNENIVTCQSVFKCKLTNCPAYSKTRCWDFPITSLLGDFTNKPLEKISHCKKCIVYKDSCGDEVGELIEAFNQMIRRLRESMIKLEETNKEKTRLEKLSALGEMSMTVAHEIKNPLNAIRGSVAYLKDNFQGKVLHEFLTIIEDETKRLNEIVRTFMTFSRPMPITLQLDDINKCIKETLNLIRHEARENNVEFITDLDETIMPFYFDSNQFKQALLNIFVNSFDATRPGDSINIITNYIDSMVQITISDTGEGMKEEVKKNIFKPFFTTKTRGTGLGLACVERIIKEHNGKIDVKSVYGKGTEFIISIPFIVEPTT